MSLHNELKVFQLLIKLLSREMDIDQSRIMIFNSEWNIPTDKHLFISLDCLPSKIIANRNREVYDLGTSSYKEVQDLTIQETIVIGVYSKNLEAMERKEEVLMALASIYSQQLQEENSIRIFKIAPIQDLSILEGGSRLYRYDIPIVLFSWQQKSKEIPYFENFDVELRVNDGQPDIVVDIEQQSI